MKKITIMELWNWKYWFRNWEIPEKEKDQFSNMSVIEISEEEYERLNSEKTHISKVEEWVKSRLVQIF